MCVFASMRANVHVLLARTHCSRCVSVYRIHRERERMWVGISKEREGREERGGERGERGERSRFDARRPLPSLSLTRWGNDDDADIGYSSSCWREGDLLHWIFLSPLSLMLCNATGQTNTQR